MYIFLIYFIENTWNLFLCSFSVLKLNTLFGANSTNISKKKEKKCTLKGQPNYICRDLMVTTQYDIYIYREREKRERES